MLFYVSFCAAAPEIEHIVHAFRTTQTELQDYMEVKNYGEGVQQFFLGLICVASEYNAFFRPRRDRYTKERKVAYKYDFEVIRHNTFECEAVLSYDTLLTASSEEIGRLIHQVLTQAPERLYKQLPKLGAFNITGLVEDVKLFSQQRRRSAAI